MTPKTSRVLLLLILFFGLLIRVWGLDRIPIELFGDELDAGYQAYSLLKTGKDYLGNPFPLYLKSFSEYRAPLFIYSEVPTIAIWGLNESGVRMAPALWGVLSLWLLYLLLTKIYNRNIALLSTFLLAVTPWHLQYSRAAFEVTMLLAVVLAGVIFWLKSRKDSRFLPAALALLGATPLVYSSATGFIPFLIPLLWYFFRPAVSRRSLAVSAAMVIVFGLVYLQNFLGPQAGARLTAVGLLSDSKIADEITFKRGYDAGIPFAGFFHNRYVIFARETVKNYFTAFSPQFLALDGDPNPAHSAIGGGFGELWHVAYLLAIIGVGTWVVRRQRGDLFLVGWLAIAPISSAVTIGGGLHATRLFLMLPPLVAASATGVVTLIKFVRSGFTRSLTVGIVGSALVLEMVFFAHHYLIHYRIESWRAWQYGYKAAMQSLPDKAPLTFISYRGEPTLIRYLFYQKVEPTWFQRNFVIDQFTPQIIPGFNGFNVGPKLWFGNLQEGVAVEKFLTPGSVYLAVQGQDIPGDWDWSKTPPVGMTALRTVNDPEFGKPLLEVVTREAVTK
jgi:4-amino-4-deoxy-L-arabinose transferase-like glycosyltransferase